MSGLITLILIVFSVWSLKPISTYVTYFIEDISFRNALFQTTSAYGFNLYQKGISYKEAALKIPERLWRSVDIPSLVVDIEFKNMQKIIQKRQQALDEGFLKQLDDDFVPASIRYKDRTIKVELRLKGDLTDHLDGDKWPFRVHTKSGDQLFGMRRFSIQHPQARGYQGEIIYFETLKRVGVLTPRYFFVQVNINGRDIGLMAVEEHFSKELLEHQGRRESVIVRFDESLVWAAKDGAMAGIAGGAFDNYRNARIDAFQDTKIQKSEMLKQQYRVAVGLLRGGVEGTLPISKVFDAEQLGRFLAVTHFWGASHALKWHNLRFCFNPLTMHLEPIAFDGELQVRSHPGDFGSVEFIQRMLSDDQVNESYVRTLKTIMTDIQDGNLISHLQSIERPHLNILQSEFVFLESFDGNELQARADEIVIYLDQLLNDKQQPTTSYVNLSQYPQLIHAYRVEEGGLSYVELANTIPYPVQIYDMYWQNGDGRQLPLAPIDPVDLPLILPATPLNGPPVFTRITYKMPPDIQTYHLTITAGIGDQEERLSHTAVSYFPPLSQSPLMTSDVDTQLRRHPFLHLVSSDSSFIVLPGVWLVRQSIVLPQGYRLSISEGTTLRFASDALLIVHGAVNARGTSESPIIIEGMVDENGAKDAWPGIVVMRAEQISEWNHVTVRNTAGISIVGWGLTGGVTFYKSDVNLVQCTLIGNLAEDALNIIHAAFELRDVSIIKTASDAFDADFSTGLVSSGLFQDVGQMGGGDGIDISGSDVTVEGTQFLRIGDKALSVGEQSRMIVRNVKVEDAVTGAVSKDNSTLELYDSTFINSRLAAIMAYSKKPEYGPGSFVATHVTIQGSSPVARVQHGSRIILDGQEVPTEPLNVDRLYDTIMKKGPG